MRAVSGRLGAVTNKEGGILTSGLGAVAACASVAENFGRTRVGEVAVHLKPRVHETCTWLIGILNCYGRKFLPSLELPIGLLGINSLFYGAK